MNLSHLTSFQTPPDGDHLTEAVLIESGVTELHVKAADRLTREELEWLFIDEVGSFEVTHCDYVKPPPELLARAGNELCDLFRKIGDVRT